MMFHNTEKAETHHGNAPRILFVTRSTTPKSLKELALFSSFKNLHLLFHA